MLAAGGEKEYWRNEFVSHAVAVTPVINGEREQVTALRWKGIDMRHKAGRWRFTGELICSSRKAGGYGGESPEWRPVHGVMIFYPALLSINSKHGSSHQ